MKTLSNVLVLFVVLKTIFANNKPSQGSFSPISGSSVKSTLLGSGPTTNENLKNALNYSGQPFVNCSSHPILLVTTAVPNQEMARKFARELVGGRIAALVNIFQPGTSVFEWDGELQESSEILLFMYTHESRYERLEEYIRANHVDVEPGVVQLPVVGGSESFLEWIRNQTIPTSGKQNL